MSANEIHLGDTGTIIEVTVKDGATVVDVSEATTKQFVFRKPNRATLTKTAEFSADGTDGRLRYTTVADDLDIDGPWQLQVRLALPAGEWRSDLVAFTVYPNL